MVLGIGLAAACQEIATWTVDPDIPYGSGAPVLDVQAWFNLANMERREGHLQEALTAYRTVLKLKPQHWKASLHTAVTLIGLQKPQEAQAALKAALQMSGQSLLLDRFHTWHESIVSFVRPCKIAVCLPNHSI